MSYSKKIAERAAKYKAFFSDTSPGQILVIIPQYTFNIDYSALDSERRKGGLDDWDFDTEAREFIERQVKRLKYFMEYTKDLDNDHIPMLSPGFGIGAMSAFFSGSDIEFGKDTSWIHPVISQWEDTDNLTLSQENKWFKLIMNLLSYICDFCDGSYVPGTLPQFAPADMANALRGNQLFYDFDDYPEKVHKLMDKSADAIIWLQKEMWKLTRPLDNGRCVSGMWFPGNTLFMSEDAPDLCSPRIYTEFCRPYTQKVIDNLGGAFIHHHAKGKHIHPYIAQLEGLKALEISWDPNCPRPIDNIVQLFEQNNGLPIQIRCTAADVYEKIEEIKQGRIILSLNIDNLDEGKEVMKFIRRHSRI